MAEARLLEEVKGLGKLYGTKAQFYEQLRALDWVRKEAGTGPIYPISVRDASYARLNGKTQEVRYGTRTCHAPVLARDSPVVVARISPLVTDLDMAHQAVQAHFDSKYPVFDRAVYDKWHEIAEKDKGKKPEKRRAIVLPERGNFRVNKGSEDAEFFWQDTMQDYFNRFVSGGSVKAYQVSQDEVDSLPEDKSIVNYLWFYRPDYVSDLDFRGWDLYDDDWTLGVLKKTSEAGSRAGSKNFKPPYTQGKVDRIAKLVQGVRDGRLPASRLEKFFPFLKKLRQ
ncbi:MAG: hypothetical protein ACE5ES_04420 [Candidatus Nanoarchaeia archaeon]